MMGGDVTVASEAGKDRSLQIVYRSNSKNRPSSESGQPQSGPYAINAPSLAAGGKAYIVARPWFIAFQVV
jgi:hypothetical protein